MFLKRSFKKEIMDDHLITDEKIDGVLKELKTINVFLGGNRTTKIALGYFNFSNYKKVKIADVGGGGSDNFNFLENNFIIYNIDLNKQACKYSNNKKNIFPVCSDAKKISLKNKSVNISNTSLFFHHFTEKEAINILNNLDLITTDGIIINDLRRNIIALISIKLLTFVFSKSKIVKNDAPLSVHKGFTKSELKELLSKSGYNNYIIKRKWAFRWMVLINLNNEKRF